MRSCRPVTGGIFFASTGTPSALQGGAKGPVTGVNRVLRGGRFVGTAEECGSGYRFVNGPQPGYLSVSCGGRVVINLQE